MYEILLGKLLGGACIAFLPVLDYHICPINNRCKKCRVSSLESVKNSLRGQNYMSLDKYILATNLFDIHLVQLNYCGQICMINST